MSNDPTKPEAPVVDPSTGGPTPVRLEEIALEARREGVRLGTRKKEQLTPGDPETFTRGVKAFMNGEYEQALEWLRPFAEEGNGRAQVILAKMYFAGNAVEKNEEKYMYWLGRAADGGDKTAKAKLKRLKKKLR